MPTLYVSPEKGRVSFFFPGGGEGGKGNPIPSRERPLHKEKHFIPGPYTRSLKNSKLYCNSNPSTP